MKIVVWTGFRNDVAGAIDQVIELDDYGVPEVVWNTYTLEEKTNVLIYAILNFGYFTLDENERDIYE